MNSTGRSTPIRCAAIVALWATLLTSTADAQLPTTQLDWLFPPGGKTGTSFVVRVAGANQDELVRLQFTHPGITAELQKRMRGEFDRQDVNDPGVFLVTVAPVVPPGTYEARVTGRFGTSNPRSFAVGMDQEWTDDGSNKSPEGAREITVNTVANGYVDARGIDYYQVVLKQGQRVFIDCQAERIESRMDPTVVVLDHSGHELARGARYRGRDPLIDFTAPADGEYTLAVFDSIFAGGKTHYYRLRVHDGPHVDFVFPPVVAAGKTATINVFGRNLPDAETSDCPLEGVPLERVTVEIDSTPLATPGPWATSLVHTSIDAFWTLAMNDSVRLGVAQAPVGVESADNDSPAGAQLLDPIPIDLSGQFFPRRDEDWFEFSATKGQVFYIDVVAHRLGVPSDPFLLVQKVTVDDQGVEKVSEVAQVDEPGDRNNRIGSNFDTSTDDPTYRLTCDEDARYRLMVRDNFNSRDDPRKVYRLIIRPPRPDFHLVAAPEQIKVANNNQVLMFSLVLPRGGGVPLRVLVGREDGFDGEITISARGLPPGVHCRPVTIGALSNNAWLVLNASADAAPWSGPIEIEGRATVGDQETTRAAVAGSVVWGTGNRQQQVPEFRVTGDLVLSICEKVAAPALVDLAEDDVIETSVGGKIEIPIKVARQGDYKEALKFVAVGMPNEFKPKDVTVNGDKSEGVVTLEATNTRMKPGTYTFMMRCDTKVKIARNPDALASAEEDVRHIGEVISQVDEQIKVSTTARDAKVKQLQEINEALKKAVATRDAATKKTQQASAAATAGRQALDTARDAAQKDPENEELASRAAEAAKNLEQRAAEEIAAKAEVDQAEKDLAAGQTAVANADTEKNSAEAELKTHQEKRARAVAHQKIVTKQRDDSKKANAPKDVNIALVSTPVSVRVHATPIAIAADSIMVEPGKKIELPVTLERNFGFAEAVDVTVELPKGTKGLSAGKAKIEKEATSTMVELSVAEDAADSTVTVTIRGKSKFNNVNVEAARSIEVRIARPAGESQETTN